MLSANADNALVILIGDVEGDGGRHLLFDKVETVLGGLILGTADHNVKVVLVETIKDNLHAAVAHDLVNFAVFLSADKLLVLIGKLNLDAHVVLRLLDEGDVANDHQGSSDSIIGSIDVEVELLEADFGTGIDTDVREHRTNIESSRWTLRRVGVSNKPRCTVELASLNFVSVGNGVVARQLTSCMSSRTVRSTCKTSVP